MERIALVTGATRGIGKEVARQLAAAGLSVVLSGRNQSQARAVAQELRMDHTSLDVTSDASVAALKDKLSGGLDVLINNAGIALDGFNEDVARQTLETNFFGARRVTEALLPLLRTDSRIVMVSSGVGELSNVKEPLRGKFLRLEFTEEQLVDLLRRFPEEVRRNTHQETGWPSSAYRVSKVGLNAYTRLLAARLSSDPRRILVNAVCPGWVRTDMGGPSASRSPEQGARSVVWAALLPSGGPSGGFYRDGQPIDW